MFWRRDLTLRGHGYADAFRMRVRIVYIYILSPPYTLLIPAIYITHQKSVISLLRIEIRKKEAERKYAV